MRLLKTLGATALMSACGLAASAGDFEVLDVVSSETSVVIAIDSLEDFTRDLESMQSQFGDLAEGAAGGVPLPLPMPGADGTLPGGLDLNDLENVEGLDRSRGVAVMIDTSGMPAAMDPTMMLMDGLDSLPMLVLLPVTDAEALGSSLGFESRDGLWVQEETDEWTGETTTMYLRGVGDWAVMGQQPDLVRGFELQAGQTAAHMQRVGPTGRRVMDTADVVVIADVEKVGPGMVATIASMSDQFGMMADMGGMGGDMSWMLEDESLSDEEREELRKMMEEQQAAAKQQMEQLQQQLASVQAFFEAFARDGQAGLIGFGLSDDAMTVDIASQFKEGSQLASLSSAGLDASRLMTRLPEGPFIMAAAVDLKSDGSRQLMKALANLNPQMGQAMLTMQGDLLERQTGFAMVMGEINMMGMTNPLSSMAMFIESDDAAALRGALRESIRAANGTEQGGLKTTAELTEDMVTILNRPVDWFSVSMEMDADALAGLGGMAGGMGGMGGGMGGGMPDPAMLAGMMSQMSVEGYLAGVEDGVVLTYSANPTMVTKLAEAAEDAGRGLSANAMVEEVRSLLPEGRMFEMFVNFEQIGTVMGQMAGMMDPNAAAAGNPMQGAKPMAIGASTADNGMILRMAMPMVTLQKLGAAATEMMGGMGMGDPGAFDGFEEDGF